MNLLPLNNYGVRRMAIRQEGEFSMAIPIQTLINDIRAIFADSVYPGDENITESDPAGREFDETWQLLRGKTWQNLPVGEFLSGDTPIPDLTPKAFHYFLPGLLISSLNVCEETAVEVADALEFYLSPDSAHADGEFAFDDTDRFSRKMSLLTDRQRAVIVRVFEEYVHRGWTTHEKLESIANSLLADLP